MAETSEELYMSETSFRPDDFYPSNLIDCAICGGRHGGKTFYCDSCPQTFHQYCLRELGFPVPEEDDEEPYKCPACNGEPLDDRFAYLEWCNKWGKFPLWGESYAREPAVHDNLPVGKGSRKHIEEEEAVAEEGRPRRKARTARSASPKKPAAEPTRARSSRVMAKSSNQGKRGAVPSASSEVDSRNRSGARRPSTRSQATIVESKSPDRSTKTSGGKSMQKSSPSKAQKKDAEKSKNARRLSSASVATTAARSGTPDPLVASQASATSVPNSPSTENAVLASFEQTLADAERVREAKVDAVNKATARLATGFSAEASQALVDAAKELAVASYQAEAAQEGANKVKEGLGRGRKS